MNIRDYEKLIRIYDKMDGIEEVQKNTIWGSLRDWI